MIPLARDIRSDRIPVVALSLLSLLAAAPLAAQVGGSDGPQEPQSTRWTAEMVPVDPFAAPAPFGPGEHLVYGVKVAGIGAGHGFMTVFGTEDVRENPSYRVEMGIRGGILGLNVDDVYQSWMDVSTFQSWRYIRDVDQPGYEARRHYEFFPDRMTWERQDIDESGPLGSALPMDEIAFIYFIRAMDLEVGKSYSIPRYFKDDGNPVVIEVLRRDTIEVNDVTYNTIVVNPVIRTSGLFGEGGKAELHFTDDERRIMVYMKSDIPKFPGSLILSLQTVQEGFPLNPQSRAEVLAGRAERERSNAAGGGS